MKPLLRRAMTGALLVASVPACSPGDRARSTPDAAAASASASPPEATTTAVAPLPARDLPDRATRMAHTTLQAAMDRNACEEPLPATVEASRALSILQASTARLRADSACQSDAVSPARTLGEAFRARWGDGADEGDRPCTFIDCADLGDDEQLCVAEARTGADGVDGESEHRVNFRIQKGKLVVSSVHCRQTG